MGNISNHNEYMFIVGDFHSGLRAYLWQKYYTLQLFSGTKTDALKIAPHWVTVSPTPPNIYIIYIYM